MIEIVPYNPAWPDEFKEIGIHLRKHLGGLAMRIDHIGSTSVPGLAAKDIIDVQVTADKASLDLQTALALAGYKHLEQFNQDHVPPGADPDPAQWAKWFFKPAEPKRAVNLHVRFQGRANQRYPILFRDYLRTHPAIAEAYGRVKLALVAHDIQDVDCYYDIKDPVCDIIMGGAEAWAGTVSWTMGESDC